MVGEDRADALAAVHVASQAPANGRPWWTRLEKLGATSMPGADGAFPPDSAGLEPGNALTGCVSTAPDLAQIGRINS